MKRIMVVDDEQNMCEALRMLLENQGYGVEVFTGGRQAIEHLERGNGTDLVISDLKMPGVDGMSLLAYLRDNYPEIPIVLITAYGTIESAVQAMKMGAEDFITKPFEKEVITHLVERVLKSEEPGAGTRQLKELVTETGMVSQSDAMKRVLETASQVATAPTPVLITGESGTGKGLLAESIHKLGSAPDKPFVPISCPAIPETLLESELFGYRKGAFTGANSDFKGKIRMSEGGTLFMDEIAEIPLGVQAKLLRLLEEKQFEPLGSTATVTVHNRIICATNQNLEQLVREGRFREDLYYRINTIALELPPLRERTDDILPLAEFFMSRSAEEMQKPVRGLSQEVKQALQGYRWPGNIRELRNVMERAVVLTQGEWIRLGDLPAGVRGSSAGSPGGSVSLSHERVLVGSAEAGEDKLDSMERQMLQQAIDEHGGNVSAAAKALGVSRGRLRYRMKKHGLAGE